jgi:predicted glycoside hydrolase/deacetylase ChbG (UPF0249 family)
MGAIATTDARGLFTKMVVDVFRESVTPTGFLRSFFTVREEITKNLSIEVQRGTEKIGRKPEYLDEKHGENLCASLLPRIFRRYGTRYVRPPIRIY